MHCSGRSTTDASCCRLFKNLTKEVRLYAQKFIDKGRVSEPVPVWCTVVYSECL